MEKVRFGKTELMVSKVAFGGIPIMRVSKAEAVRIVREAVSLGVNFIDTATGYLDSEEKIGEALKGLKREELIIASKSPAGDKKTFNEHLDLSLKRLGLDYIDIYQLHNVSSPQQKSAVFACGGAMEGLEEAVKAGKVRFPAFSSHSLPIALEIMKTEKFAAVQLPFNYIDYDAANEAIPLADKLDIGFIAMKPMGGGLLHNAAIAFNFLCQYNVIPDPGIEKLEEIREIVEIINNYKGFTAEDQKAVEKERGEFGASWCHRCDYCQPCPKEINISTVLNIKSFFKRMTDERARLFTGAAVENARNCAECGVCVSRCPYKLEIPSLLKEGIKYWDSL